MTIQASKHLRSKAAQSAAESFKACGLSIHDLADCPFIDWHEDGYSPAEAARAAIRAENGEDF